MFDNNDKNEYNYSKINNDQMSYKEMHTVCTSANLVMIAVL